MADLTLTFSSDNLREMLQEMRQQTGADHQGGPDESTITLDQPFGHCIYHYHFLREGMELFRMQWRLQEPLRIVTHIPSYSAVTFNFCLSGALQVQFRPTHPPLLASPGKNLFEFVSGDVNSTTDYAKGQPISLVSIKLNPALFSRLTSDSIESLSSGDSVTLNTEQAQLLTRLNWTTPAMVTTLDQILNCPYQGSIKRIYLESKALELIALKLEQTRQSEPTAEKGFRLKPDDVDRIYRVRDILLNNIEHPPSLMSLAKQVGINDFKLKRGFRQIFGATVFGYLRQHRMEQARRLLTTRDLSVSQVAQTVGYASPSQFSAAFKKQFGCSPRSYKALYQAF